MRGGKVDPENEKYLQAWLVVACIAAAALIVTIACRV